MDWTLILFKFEDLIDGDRRKWTSLEGLGVLLVI